MCHTISILSQVQGTLEESEIPLPQSNIWRQNAQRNAPPPEISAIAKQDMQRSAAMLQFKPHKGFLPAMVTPVQALILHFLHNLTVCGRQHHHLPHHLDDLQEEMQLQRFAASCAVLAYFQQVLIPIELSAPRQ